MSLQSDNIDQIVPALIKAKASFKAAVKDASNPHYKSKYVTLDGVIDAIDEALLENGIFQTQPTLIPEGGKTVLYTRLLHTSGQWLGGEYPVHPIKNDPQAEGSALTYARRYALMALAGIAPEDDDGNAASKASGKGGKPQARHVAGTPTEGAWEAMDADEQAFLMDIAKHAISLLDSGDAEAAHDHIQSQNLNSDEKIALWTRFDSRQRSALKRADAASKSKTTQEAA